MSTLIGIKSLEGIVLASDLQVSEYDEDDKMISKIITQKIHYGRNWVMAYTGGGETKELRKFFGLLRGDGRYGFDKENAEKILERAVNKKRIIEVCELNAGVVRKDRDNECTYKFLLATTNPTFGFWEVDEYGNFHGVPKGNEFDYICIGSGSEEAEEYIESLVKDKKIGEYEFDKDSFNTSISSRISKRAIKSAQSDASTGFGYDIVVALKDGSIEPWGDMIQKRLEEADMAIENEIARKYHND